MAEYSDELIAKLKKAQSLEEIVNLLKADGQEVDAAEKMWEELKTVRSQEDQKLSPDELAAVAGGLSKRDWLEKGCAATVEPDSDCWGTDGGCLLCNIKYSNPPEDTRCPGCGAPRTAFTGYIGSCYTIACRKCGKRFLVEYGQWREYTV